MFDIPLGGKAVTSEAASAAPPQRRNLMRCLICGRPALANGAYCGEHVPQPCPFCRMTALPGQYCQNCHQRVAIAP